MDKRINSEIVDKYCKQGCNNCSAGTCILVQHHEEAKRSRSDKSFTTSSEAIDSIIREE